MRRCMPKARQAETGEVLEWHQQAFGKESPQAPSEA